MLLKKYSIKEQKQKPLLAGAYEQAEIGARICYKSENVIKYDEHGNSLTAEGFVDKLVKVNKHASIAEHGAIYLKIPKSDDLVSKYSNNKYSVVRFDNEFAYITTNLRVIYENEWFDDVNEFIVDKSKHHVPRLSFIFNSQCAISREAHRHRVNSPSEQSTRYCNYSKGKFGCELSISIPIFAEDCWQIKEYQTMENRSSMFRKYCQCIASNIDNPENFEDMFDYWMFGNLASEYAYLGMLKKGAKTDWARTVLPLDTHTEFMHSAYIWDWFNFLKLRCSSNAHQDIRVIANQMLKILIDQGYFSKEEFEKYDNGWDLSNV